MYEENMKSKLKILEVRINQMTKYMEILGPDDERTKQSILITTCILDDIHPEWGLKRGLELKDKRPLVNVIHSFNSGYGLNGSLRWFEQEIAEQNSIHIGDKELVI